MKLVNLCRRPITLVSREGNRIVLPASHAPARVRSVNRTLAEVFQINDDDDERTHTFDVMRMETHGTINVPPPTENTIYVVPSAVAQALPDRDDLVTTGMLTRDDSGNIQEAWALVFMAKQGDHDNGVSSRDNRRDIVST